MKSVSDGKVNETPRRNPNDPDERQRDPRHDLSGQNRSTESHCQRETGNDRQQMERSLQQLHGIPEKTPQITLPHANVILDENRRQH